jgi:hypothetical protein
MSSAMVNVPFKSPTASVNFFLNISLDTFNPNGLKEITFHGHKITSDGVKVDDKKVNAIRKMPTPTDVAGVKRLCGMVQYMAKFRNTLGSELP